MSNWATGKNDGPDGTSTAEPRNVSAVAEILGVSPAWLLTGREPEDASQRPVGRSEFERLLDIATVAVQVVCEDKGITLEEHVAKTCATALAAAAQQDGEPLTKERVWKLVQYAFSLS